MGERRLGNFNSCCRLCLSEKLGTLKSIFEDDSKGQEMARNIKHFLGVQISHNDKLTTMICENCFGQIHDWKLFKKNCDENQTKLVGWMNSWNDSNIGNISIRIKDEIVEDVDDRPIIVEDDDVVHVKTEQQEQESRDEVQANSYGGEPMDEDMYDLPPPLTPHMPGESALHGDDENGQAVDVFSDDEDDDENMSMLVPCIEFSEGREVLMNGNSNDDVNQRECTICGKEFSTPANRKKHERMIHLRKTKKQDYDLREIAERAEESLLAEKSKQRYEKAYNCFKFWCNEKGVQDVGSETVILDYFSEMSESKKAPSLWSIYSMLRTTLARKERVDISKFGKLLTFLKSKNVGYKAKKSTTFTMNNIEIFLKDGPVSFLVHKVALIIGVSGACRSDELYKMKLEDVNFLEKKVCIEIPNTKIHLSRAFMVTNEGWIKIIREYMDLRKNIQNEKFFMQVRLGKMTNQSIGHNTISQFPKKIAAFLNLPKIDTYTGHCYRRTAATLLINNGGDITQLKRLGGRKSLSVVEDYIDSSVSNQVQTARMISKNSNITVAEPSSNSPSFGSTTTQAFQISSKSVAQGINISIATYNDSNVTLNINK